ncbi:MAG: redoxin domain-containing protein [Candidatus Manganitrophaceae bacterium]
MPSAKAGLSLSNLNRIFPDRPDRKRLLIFCTLVLFLFLTGMGSKPPQIGGPAPDFVLSDLDGKAVRLSDHRGKVVLLDFWATWCEPCKKALPEIQGIYEKYQENGFVVLGVNFGEKQKDAERMARQMGLTFPILTDQKVEVAERYGVTNLPVTFFIDPDGIIRERVFGGTLTAEKIVETLKRMETK